MRRKDRQVVNWDRMISILDSCDCCRLGLLDKDEVYIVPLNFGYRAQNGCLEIYFHCAKEGRKLDLIKKCKTVSFEMDTAHFLIAKDDPCSYSFSFQSIMGTGHAVIVDDAEEKLYALGLILSHYGGDGDLLTKRHADSVEIIKVEVESWSCKENLK